MPSNYLASGVVARRLSIKTQTLASWRCKGKGPQGWIHLSATRVVYPEEQVEAFIERLAGRRPEFNFKNATAPKIATGNGVNE